EQCGILTLPEIAPPLGLTRVLAARDPARLLVFCDEDAEVRNPVAALTAGGAPAPPPPPRLAGPGRAGGGGGGGGRGGGTQAPHGGAPCAGAAHPARRHRRGRGARAGCRRTRGLALNLGVRPRGAIATW